MKPINKQNYDTITASLADNTTQHSFLDQLKLKFIYGAIGDGLNHPLSSKYATLALAQAKYPCAVALTDEIDHCALQTAITNEDDVFIPKGTFIHTSLVLKLNSKLTGNYDNSILQNNSNTSSIIIGNVEDILISNIFLKGNITMPNQDAIEFIGLNPACCIIDRCAIEYFGRHGIHGGHLGHVNNVEIKGCFIRGCVGDGINMQYGYNAHVTQINAIWIHHNDIVYCNNGILFFGNNVIVEKNTIQANLNYGVSVSEDLLDTLKSCYSSSINNNYFELNASAVASNASVIGIFTGVDGTTTTNKYLYGLDISNNYFAESGSKYSSIIYCKDLKNSNGSNCILMTKNNYTSINFITLNKDSALSPGSIIDETAYVNELPSYVQIRGKGMLLFTIPASTVYTTKILPCDCILSLSNITGGSNNLISLGTWGGVNGIILGTASIIKDTANKINIYFEGGFLKIQNNTASSNSFTYKLIFN